MATSGAMNEYDRVYHEDSMIVKRPPLAWPGGHRAAFSVVVCAEYYELQPPDDAFVPPNVPGGFGRAPYPDVRAFSQREYGNRVGVFRVMEALDKQQIRATAAADAVIAARYPFLIEQFQKRHWEIAAHGYSLTRVISNRMSEEQERNYIRTSLEAVEKASGTRPRGWHGPEYGESERTPALLAEFGVKYVLDWPNDEQPYLMNTPSGTIASIPMALELDDVITHYHRRIGLARWRQAVAEALDQLLADGDTGGRQLVLALHPWLIGHPHRIGYLEDVLADAASRSDLWITTTGEIADFYLNQPPSISRAKLDRRTV
jgi:peptidoglycan/xylan/chitin deacetylase (PgdA/CDA1 family)